MIRFLRFCTPVLLVLSLSGFGGLDALFAPKAELWERWLAHDPASGQRVDHRDWDRFLKTYVDDDPSGLNRVAYGKVSDADAARLRAYLQRLSETPVSRLSRPEQLAYWINAYNALTVDLVVQHYPVKSIRDIDLGGGGLFSSGPWSKKMFAVEGERLSLNEIEHRILRPVWKDPRLHYALNCASVGCPDLQPTAYTSALVEPMLEDAARAFVNAARNVRIANGAVTVSSLYSWFVDDFGGSESRVLEHLRTYADAGLTARLQQVSKISGHSYDWALNGVQD